VSIPRTPVRDVFLSEFLATAFLLIAVVGSGIAAEALSGGIVGLALLANALATGAALYALILVFGPISGAHMNPVVSLAAAVTKGASWSLLPFYFSAQILGAISGTLIAHAMFALPLLQLSSHVRAGAGQWIAEAVATSGLLVVIWGCMRYGRPVLAGAVAAYVAGAYWFTASTSFANPAVTLARALTDTFAGIRPLDAPGFIAAQCLGLVLALPLLRLLNRSDAENLD
jgi:glycerol uptake facilitator-like aquaporin